VRDRIAENAEPNGRIDIARCLGPPLEVGQRIALGGFFLFFHGIAQVSLTPCFSWVLEANHGISTASAVYRSDRGKLLKQFGAERGPLNASLKQGVNKNLQKLRAQ
jgi:hypothetical protein